MSDTVYIYALIDVRDKSIFYVGQTNNILRRYNIYLRRDQHSPKLQKAMAGMRAARRYPMMKILEVTDIYKSNGKERGWIRTMFMAGHPLLNTTCIRNWKEE